MSEALARRLAELESASTADLRARWERAYRHPAPKRASRDLLLRALAYPLAIGTIPVDPSDDAGDGGGNSSHSASIAAAPRPRPLVPTCLLQ